MTSDRAGERKGGWHRRLSAVGRAIYDDLEWFELLQLAACMCVLFGVSAPGVPAEFHRSTVYLATLPATAISITTV